MREILNISQFNAGIINALEGSDIPLEACSFSENVDGDVAEGILSGVPSAAVFNSDSNIHTGSFILRSDGKYDLVSYNAIDHKIEHCSDFYGMHLVTVQRSGLVPSNTATLKAKNREIRAGVKGNRPVWTGYVDSRHFQDAVSDTGLYTFDAELTPMEGAFADCFYLSVENASSPNIFSHTPGSVLRYAFSLIYDGYQESYLSGHADLNYEDIGSDVLPYGCPYITVYYNGTALSNKRVTGLRVYRAVKNPDADYFGEYKVLRDIALNANADLVITDPYSWDDGWKLVNDNQVYRFYDDKRLGASYFDNTGMPEGLSSTMVNYSLACIAENQLIAGDCTHPEIADASHCLFMSKEGRFDMFDWSNDILRLPFVPKALAYFNGRIFAFDTNRYFKINPKGFYIEDEFQGAGCSDPRAVVVTEWGMFFANKDNVWFHDGRQPNPIGDIIRRANIGQDWLTDAAGGSINAVFSTEKGYVLFCLPDSSITKMWAYNPSRKRWDYFKIAGALTGLFSGKDGETYMSTGSSLLKLFSGPEESWYWISGELTLNEPSQKKKFYKIIVNCTGSITIQFKRDTDNDFITGSIPENSRRKFKTLRIKLSGSGSTTVRSISLIYRKLAGAR